VEKGIDRGRDSGISEEFWRGLRRKDEVLKNEVKG
jgi:hypothetical protein